MDMITPSQVDEQRLQELAGKAASDAASGLAGGSPEAARALCVGHCNALALRIR